MIYSVIGTGAVGGYYGGRLANAGKEVHFLFHSDYQYVTEHGLQVNSCNGDFHIDNVNAYNDTSKMPKSDVVLVALKSVNESLLYKVLPPLLHPGTLVLLIQNGIGLEQDLVREFPDVETAAGLAFICSSKTKPGVVDHQCYGSINIGNYNCKNPQKISQLINDLQQSGVDAHEVEYHEARWRKAVWNMPFNGMSVVKNANTQELLTQYGTLIYDQMKEVIDAANALGVKSLDYTFADKMIEMTKVMVPYYPSMKLDYDFRRPMEIYYLYTRPIEEARKAGFEMRLCAEVEAQLRELAR
ncbi:MAG: 2-dehydropantoate 2-reductase [Bacteroidales bacterium]|nr:2-dehydropantoate 2-reductase [Bacteroidales bacterium]